MTVTIRRNAPGTLTITGGHVVIPPSNPTVSSISPALGNDRGGTAFTITGSQFTGATSVTLCGQAVSSFTVVNDTTITGHSGAKLTNIVGDVTVHIPSGVGSLTNGYEYLTAASRGTLVEWYRGDLGATLSGSMVIAFASQTGTGNDITDMSVGAIECFYFASDASFNGKAAWGTNGVDGNALLGNDAFVAPYSFPLTVLHTFRVPASTSGQNVYLRLGPGGSDSNSVALGGVSGATWNVNAGAAGLSFSLPNDTTLVVTTIYDPVAGAVFVNTYSTPLVAGDIDTSASTLNGLSTGCFDDTEIGQYLNAEIAIYQGILSPADIQTLTVHYMGDAYGVTVTA